MYVQSVKSHGDRLLLPVRKPVCNSFADCVNIQDITHFELVGTWKYRVKHRIRHVLRRVRRPHPALLAPLPRLPRPLALLRAGGRLQQGPIEAAAGDEDRGHRPGQVQDGQVRSSSN